MDTTVPFQNDLSEEGDSRGGSPHSLDGESCGFRILRVESVDNRLFASVRDPLTTIHTKIQPMYWKV
jgi:hypothetical protein